MVASDPQLERYASLFRITDGRRDAGVRNGNDHVGLYVTFIRQFTPESLATLVDALSTDDTVRSSEVDVLKDAGALRFFRERFVALNPVSGNHDHLSIFHFADEFCADDIQCTGFGSENVALVHFAQDQWPDSQRVAHADEFVVGDPDQCVGPVDFIQGIDHPVDGAAFGAAGDQVQDGFRVRGGLKNGA